MFLILGTDNLGRDVGLRLVQGTRIAFHVGIVTSLIADPTLPIRECYLQAALVVRDSTTKTR